MLFLGFALVLSLSTGYRSSVAFHIAARNGNVQRVMDLVEAEGASKLDIDGAFLRAASNGHVGVMEYLLEKGASDSTGALVCAAINNQVPTVKYLTCHPCVSVDRAALKFAAVAAGNNDSYEAEFFLLTKLRHGVDEY
jgi:ankyrin repeat protein